MRRDGSKQIGLLLGLLAALMVTVTSCRTAPVVAPTATAPAAVSQSTPASAVMGIEMREVGGSLRRTELAQKTGASWVRYQVQWNELEPERLDPPAYVWAHYDETLLELSEQGMQIVATLRDNPAWAASTACGALNAEGQKAYPQMLTALVRRYSVAPYSVKHWEITNEPDNGDPVKYPNLGGCWGNDPAGYAALLKVAYETIKAVDPQAVVVFGGVALERFDDSPFNVDFVKQVLEAGGGPYFDWMNFHYYAAFSYRWDKFGRGVEGKAAYLRNVMKEAGVEKPIVCSEIGQPSAGPAAEGYSDEKMQHMLVRQYTQAISAGMRFVIWYCWQDSKGDERAYGLLGADSRSKPAFQTLAMLGKALSDARFERVLSADETGSEALEAYLFTLPASPKKSLIIAWRNDDGATVPLPIARKTARVTDVAGKVVTLSDGDPGDLNPAKGALSLGVGPAPILIVY